MIENIVMYIENGATALVALAVYLHLVIAVYPRLFLKPVWKGGDKDTPTVDRGVQRFLFPGGRAIVYEPAPRSRRYLRQYALIKEDGCTFLKCRIHPNIAHMRYDVATFDRNGKLLDVLKVSERISERGCTQLVRLPRDTAYACVTLRKADRMYTDRTVLFGSSRKGIGIFTGITVLTSLVFGGVLHSCLSVLFEALPIQGEVNNLALTLLAAALLGTAAAEWMIFRQYAYASKVINR